MRPGFLEVEDPQVFKGLADLQSMVDKRSVRSLAVAAGTISKATTNRPTISIADTVTIATTVVSR